MTALSPAFRYYGAKWKLGKKITPLLSHIKHRYFIEPYCGSAAITIQKNTSDAEVLNDICGEVTNFFRMLRDYPEEITRAVALTPYSREEWVISFEVADNPVERARRFLCRQGMSISTTPSRLRKSGFRNYFDRDKRDGPAVFQEWEGRPDKLWAIARRLRGVLIEQLPATECIQKYDHEDALFFVDPPYEKSTRSAPNQGYDSEMATEDHLALIGMLAKIKGKAIVTHYPSKTYESGLAGFREFRFNASAGFVGNSKRTECVWLSPNIKLLQMDLFEKTGGAA